MEKLRNDLNELIQQYNELAKHYKEPPLKLIKPKSLNSTLKHIEELKYAIYYMPEYDYSLE